MKKHHLLLITLISLFFLANMVGLYLLRRPALSVKSTRPDSSEQLDALNHFFPQEQGVVDLLGDLNRLGHDFSRFQINFDSDEPLTLSRLRYLPVTISTTGTLDQTANFWQQWLNAPFVIEVVKAEVKKNLVYPDQFDSFFKINLFVADNYEQ
ncbi:MAG: hypothetical protein ABH807_01840 [Candidatus Shapirobacteria bacterium]